MMLVDVLEPWKDGGWKINRINDDCVLATSYITQYQFQTELEQTENLRKKFPDIDLIFYSYEEIRKKEKHLRLKGRWDGFSFEFSIYHFEKEMNVHKIGFSTKCEKDQEFKTLAITLKNVVDAFQEEVMSLKEYRLYFVTGTKELKYDYALKQFFQNARGLVSGVLQEWNHPIIKIGFKILESKSDYVKVEREPGKYIEYLFDHAITEKMKKQFPEMELSAYMVSNENQIKMEVLEIKYGKAIFRVLLKHMEKINESVKILDLGGQLGKTIFHEKIKEIKEIAMFYRDLIQNKKDYRLLFATGAYKIKLCNLLLNL